MIQSLSSIVIDKWSSSAKQNGIRSSILFHIINKNELKLLSKSFKQLQKATTIKIHTTNNQMHEIQKVRMKQKFVMELTKLNDEYEQKTIFKTWSYLLKDRKIRRRQLLKKLNRMQSSILQSTFSKFRVRLQARSTVYFAQRLTNESLTSNKLRQKMIKSNQIRNIFTNWFQSAHLQHNTDIALIKINKIYMNVKLRQGMKIWRRFNANTKINELRDELDAEIQSSNFGAIYEERYYHLKRKAIAMTTKRRARTTLYWFIKWKSYSKHIADGKRLLKRMIIRKDYDGCDEDMEIEYVT